MLIKLCGLTTPPSVAASLAAKVDMIGLNFFPKSPRYVSLADAVDLAEPARGRTAVVALTVNTDDDELQSIRDRLRPDYVQCHGSETPERMEAIRRLTNTKIIRAVRVASPEDVVAALSYVPAADLLLFDAKPNAGEGLGLPGGNGVVFDWSLMQSVPQDVPYLLSGGLDADNVADAIAQTGCPGVDVSSGIESAPGRKDAARIAAFVEAARAAAAQTPGPGKLAKVV